MLKASQCQVFVPQNLNELTSKLASEPHKWKILAGGTDIMVELHAEKSEEINFASLHNLAELKGITYDSSALTIGATTTYSEILEHPIIASEFSNLREAALFTGAKAIQNVGTLGGNIANASPAADSPPALLAYDAEIELTSATGARWIRYANFHTGYKTTAMTPLEIITRIRIPRFLDKRIHYYRKVGPRKALAISKVCVAAVATLKNKTIVDIQIGVGSIAPTSIKLVQTEKQLSGKTLTPKLIEIALNAIDFDISPITDIRSTKEYRTQVVKNMIKEFLEGLLLCGAG